jgi:hypothetical protein
MSEAFQILWEIRNNLFHGVSISDNVAVDGLELATLLKAKLDILIKILCPNQFIGLKFSKMRKIGIIGALETYLAKLWR